MLCAVLCCAALLLLLCSTWSVCLSVLYVLFCGAGFNVELFRPKMSGAAQQGGVDVGLASRLLYVASQGFGKRLEDPARPPLVSHIVLVSGACACACARK